MKQICRYSIGFMLLTWLITISSCSKKSDEGVPPLYVGTWDINLSQSTATNTVPIKQTLVITKDSFTDTFYLNNSSVPYIVATGSYTVIQNIANITFLKLGKTVNQNPMVFLLSERH